MTDVGVIPEDWEPGRLRDYGKFKSGSGFPLVFQGRQVGDYPFFKVSDMNNEGNALFMSTANHWICEDTRRILGATAFPAGSIVFAKIGAAIFLERKRMLSRDSCLDNNMMAYLLSDRDACTQFFHSLFLRIELGKLVSTTALPSLSGKELGAICVPVPPPLEQRAIAKALSDVDAVIGAIEALIAKKRAIKQAAMQQLLTGKTRLPGFGGEWVTKRLGDVIDKLVGGGTPSRGNPAFWGNEIPWATVKDFATFNARQTQESITKLGLDNSASHLIPAGTLITSTRMALGKAVVFDVDVAINQDLKAVFLRPDTNVIFLLYWFECHERLIDDLGSGSTVKGISIGQLTGLPFPGLSLDEQTAIATVLSDVDLEIAALERRREKTHAIKQGMMQQLLTGRVRLIPVDQRESNG